MLLILAVVAIGAVTNDGIINYAKNARNDYVAEQVKENTTLKNYLDIIKENVPTGTGTSAGNGGTSGENTPIGNLGKYVKYDANGDGSVEDETILWRVLRDDADKVELITADSLGSITLISEEADFNEVRTAYNNVVTILVQKCVELTGISSVRSVGGPATEEAMSDTNTVDFSEIEEFGAYHSKEDYTQYEGSVNGFRKENRNCYTEDFNQMQKAGVWKADNSVNYWFATRCVQVRDEGAKVAFGIICCDIAKKVPLVPFVFGLEFDPPEFNVWRTGYGDLGVRPILELESGILNNLTGEGTKTDPIKIY